MQKCSMDFGSKFSVANVLKLGTLRLYQNDAKEADILYSFGLFLNGV